MKMKKIILPVLNQDVKNDTLYRECLLLDDFTDLMFCGHNVNDIKDFFKYSVIDKNGYKTIKYEAIYNAKLFKNNGANLEAIL